ncbi:MAG: hypothetical protein BGO69_03725 [Bacteroidetes bacterium 46-16]|nr:MAG: hypothetical protein BGO69_03725 [Bacteroidetes bacterium 46-16]
MVRKLLQPFYSAWVILSFVVCLLLLFPFFIAVSIPNNAWARRSIWRIIRPWSQFWLLIVGMPMRIQGPKPPQRRYVIVANHISYMDTVVVFSAIPWYFRALGKAEMSSMPLLGFIYKQIVIMVKRDSAHNRARSMRLMWRAVKYESSVLVFPEGTFNETAEPVKELFDGAFRLAINAQTPIFPMIFPDTVDRWHYSHWWAVWPGRNRAIYLDPIPVDGLTLADVPALKEKVGRILAEALRKAKPGYPMS